MPPQGTIASPDRHSATGEPSTRGTPANHSHRAPSTFTAATNKHPNITGIAHCIAT